MIDPFDPLEGQTPLDPNEMEGLIPHAIANRRDLNQLENAYIDKARQWALERRHTNILSDTFIKELHRRMFKDVWKWAGCYRTTMKNIGVVPEQISIKVRELCEDAAHWVEQGIFSWDELASRLHHRLVLIHPFPNGNGRHARMMANVLLHENGQEIGTWGARQALDQKETDQALRSRYLAALRAADSGEYGLLVSFLRS